MRTTLLLSTLLLTLFACNVSTETDYENIAKDTCGCINLFTSDLSPKMVEVIESSKGDETALQEAMMEYIQADPVQGMADVQMLENGANLEKMEACMEKIEKKYDDVYTTLSEEEIVAKVIEKLETMDGCKSSIAILNMGMAAK